MPQRKSMPSTVRRSPPKAQRTWSKVHEHARQQYGEGERAHRTAFAALKHSFEKKGDHWTPKAKKGPSDPRSKQPTAAKRRGKGETFGGVDLYGNTKQELMRRARALGVRGRASMSKKELARAISRKQ